MPTANGISDDWENTYLGGTNAALGGAMEDRDGDGFSNLHEYIAGTNPTNAASLLKLGSRLGLTTGQPHPGLRALGQPQVCWVSGHCFVVFPSIHLHMNTHVATDITRLCSFLA